MIMILRFIVFFLLAPAFAIVAQAAGAVQDDFRIADAGFRGESVMVGSLDGGIFNYDSSGALLHQRKSLDGEDDLNRYGEFETSGATRPLFSFLAELGATNRGGLSKATPEQLKAAGFQDHHILSDKNVLTKNHDLLTEAGFNLQSRSNKIFLPSDASLHPTRSIHMGRHTTGVSRNLAEQMDVVLEYGRGQGWSQQQYRQALDAIIREERALLRSGQRALNKNSRPGAE